MAADDRLDPRHQLFQGERLGDVVVGAKLEARDPVADRRAGADADESRVRLGPEGLEQLWTVVVGEHQVEEHDVGVPFPNELQPPASRLDRTDCVAFLTEPGGDRPREAPVVLHEGDLPLDGHAQFSHGIAGS